MKQKLFENVGGNQFKLITESVEDVIPNVSLVREGLKKVFGAGSKELTYKRLHGVGLGYIKHVEDAKKTAIQEARILAKEYGYTDNEDSQKFIKEDGEMSDYDRGSYENERSPVSTSHSETDMSNPSEAREVQIGKQIINLLQGTKGIAKDYQEQKQQAIGLAQELIQMHMKA